MTKTCTGRKVVSLFGCVLVLSLWESFCVAFAQSPDWRDRFLKEAPAKWAEYDKLSLSLQMESKTWERWRGIKEYPAEPVEHVQIKRDEGGTLLFCMIEAPFQRRCCVMNERYAFDLRRKEQSSPWVITAISTDLEHPDDVPFINEMLNKDTVKSGGPFQLYRSSLPMLIEQPGFKVTEATSVQREQGSLVRVDFVCSSENALSGRWQYEKGWFIVDPDHYWAVLEFEAEVIWPGRQEIKTRTHGTIEYGETKSGLPIMKSSLVLIQGKNSKGPKTDLDHEIKTEYVIQERSPSPAEFTLSAFGLPEPFGVDKAKPRWYLWAAGAAISCFIAGAVIRRLGKRSA